MQKLQFFFIIVVVFMILALGSDGTLALTTCSGTVPMKHRKETISIEDYGAVGDGRTVNTWPFQKAIYRIKHLRRRGGTLLYVPPGVWLTGSFNLTSHMTLFLAKGATIKAVQDTESWALVDPLPSYGRGRERPGGRYMSFVNADRIHDVIITGENGTIDGQGGVWWDLWRNQKLLYNRPNLVELMHSKDIIISNVIFKNSPFWNIHPVYCTNVVIQHVMILAPHDSPNTDGIDPDSSNNICIEDSYISTGDDLVSIKSGWDEYGISYGRPSYDITIRRIKGSTPFAGVSIGSEASGGVHNILMENINIYNSGIGVHIKTEVGRGGYIKNVTISGVNLYDVQHGIKINGGSNDHPDSKYDPNAIPDVRDIAIKNVWGVNVEQPGSIRGIKDKPFTGIFLSNVKLWTVVPWKCTDVSGCAIDVRPWPCTELTGSSTVGFCSTSM